MKNTTQHVKNGVKTGDFTFNTKGATKGNYDDLRAAFEAYVPGYIDVMRDGAQLVWRREGMVMYTLSVLRCVAEENDTKWHVKREQVIAANDYMWETYSKR